MQKLGPPQFGTDVVHAGQDPDPMTGSIIFPITLSTTFRQLSPSVHQGYDYNRSGNPTRAALESNLAKLERGQWALSFSSGMAAISTCLQLLQSGDHFISCNELYGGSYRYFSKVAQLQNGLECTYFDFSQPDQLEKEIKSNTKLIWLESPANPLLTLCDLAKVVEVAHRHQLMVIADNTLMSPCNQKPLQFGVDIVCHSVTKYINGHSDVLMGALIGNDNNLLTRLSFLQNAIGAVPSPFDCFLVLRGVKTLELRIERHNTNALAIAKYLESHSNVERVLYTGLVSHPQYELARRQQEGDGGMVSFYIKGGLKEATQFASSLKIFILAESLGSVHSLCNHPALMTHASIPQSIREGLGIFDNLLRLSIGIEDYQDLIHDLEQAFKGLA